MKKTVFCLVVGCSLIFVAQHAFAAKCYNFTGFGDIVKVLSGSKVINGVWYLPGQYYMPFVGTIITDSNPDFNRLSIHLTNNQPTQFGGFTDCVVDATLSKTAPIQGTAIIECGGGGFFTMATLAQVDCRTVSPFDAPLPLSEGSLAIGSRK